MSTQLPLLLTALLEVLDESQAFDVKTIDVRDQTTITDYMIVTSGRSPRHVKAIARAAMDKLKSLGLSAIGDHGLDSGDWVLVDFGDYVLHVMQPENRVFYNIEGLWQLP